MNAQSSPMQNEIPLIVSNIQDIITAINDNLDSLHSRIAPVLSELPLDKNGGVPQKPTQTKMGSTLEDIHQRLVAVNQLISNTAHQRVQL